MNLRTHTFLIPALCGVGAFALLVVADFSVRRLMNGPDYGLAAYLADRGPDPDAALRPAVAAAAPTILSPALPPPAQPLPRPVLAPAPAAPPPALPVEARPLPQPEVAIPAALVVEAQGFSAQCTSDKGFKRCRIDN